MNTQLSRRRFLQTTSASLGLLGLGVHGSLRAAESTSPNEKIRLGIIGTANRARANIAGVQHEAITAICDVDGKYLDKMKADFPKAQAFVDFRKLLELKELDAVVVSTADHTHAPASYWAMQQGKHVYCEKPLTHTVTEARMLAKIAADKKLATQMGTQIHAGDNYRRVVELIQAGAIGKIKEVHTWVGKGWGVDTRPIKEQPAPETFAWDLWLGPAAERPYHDHLHPADWRRYWDFGNGTLGDMACHHMDLPFWALGLRAPSKVRAEGPSIHPTMCPQGLKVIYAYAATSTRPEFTLTWYDGNLKPAQIHGVETGGGGNLFVGDKGMLRADYGSLKLLPEADFKDYQRPEPTIAKSPGHYIEWFNAIRTGSPTTCNFDYSGALTEAVLLGNVAYRAGKEIEWDAAKMKIPNATEAEAWLTKKYRSGWALA